MSNPLSDILHLMLPARCAACGEILPQGKLELCLECSADMPATGYCLVHDNPVRRRLEGLMPVEEASSLIFYSSHSRYRDMIHNLKYHNQWNACRYLGRLLGEEMKRGGLYADVDMIVPMPLHYRRMLTRGYNQAEYLARGIAAALGKPVVTDIVARSRHNPSQTKASRSGRWDNVEGIFAVRCGVRRLAEAEIAGAGAGMSAAGVAEKHILLVDDVLTTGATLVTCAEAILAAVPSVRISVATLAASSYELFPSKP